MLSIKAEEDVAVRRTRNWQGRSGRRAWYDASLNLISRLVSFVSVPLDFNVRPDRSNCT